MSIFSERLVAKRLEAGYSQKELAELLAITPTRLNYWEKGKREPDVKFIKEIAKLLNTSGDYLLGTGFDEESPENTLSPEALAIARKYEQLDKYGKKMVETVVDLEIQRRNDEEYERRVAAYGAVHKEAIDQMLEREAKERERLLDEQSDFPERSERSG